MSVHPHIRHSLRLSIDSSPRNYVTLKAYSNTTPDSGSPASSVGLSNGSTNSTTSSSGDSSWRICSVLCLHDYTSSDPTHLSFARNEILEIVQQEESGWWAALRIEDNRVGWISSAFVEPLSEELADRLRSVPEPLRALEYDEEIYPESSPAQIFEPSDPMAPLSAVSDTQSNWLPNIEKIPATPATRHRFSQSEEQIPAENYLSPRASPIPMKQRSFDVPATDSEPESWSLSPIDGPRTRGLRHSPSAPGPRAPRNRTEKHASSRPLSVSHRDDLSVPEPTPHRADHNRSHSESSSPHRHLRRRPLLLDDSSSLTRLSTLIESHNTAELDVFAHSPLESVDAFSRLAVKSPLPQEVAARMRPLVVIKNSETGGRVSPAMSPMPSPRLASSWFMRPSYDEDDMRLDYDGTVKAATLPALVERLALDYLKSSEEMKFRHAFLSTYRTFSTADEVFDLVVARYNMEHPQGLAPDEIEEWREKKLRISQHRILTLLTMWIEDHSLALEEPHIVHRLEEFLSGINEPVSLALAANLMIQALHRSTQPAPQIPILSTPSLSRRWRHKAVTDDPLKMDVIELAQQLCLLEHRLYAKIRVQDCWAWRRTSSALSDFCSTHEKLATWVRKSIEKVDGARKKAETIDFWIHCAEKCKAMHNISSMNAIVTALSRKAFPSPDLVHRMASLDAMIKLGDPTDNFVAYKNLLQSIEGACVPFIGMYLVEIIEINDQYPDTISCNNGDLTTTTLINFTKRQKWAEVIDPMLRFQSRAYGYPEAQQMMSLIEGHIGLHPVTTPEAIDITNSETILKELAGRKKSVDTSNMDISILTGRKKSVEAASSNPSLVEIAGRKNSAETGNIRSQPGSDVEAEVAAAWCR